MEITAGLPTMACASIDMICPDPDDFFHRVEQTPKADQATTGLLHYQLQLQRLKSGALGFEFFITPGVESLLTGPDPRRMSISVLVNHPFSRGTVVSTVLWLFPSRD